MDRTPAAGVVDTVHSTHAVYRSLPFDAVQLRDGFWSRWQRINRREALTYGHTQLVESGALDNFAVAAGRKTGAFQNMRFADSDLYKWLEAASFELARQPDAWIRQRVDEAIDLIAAAQRQDGYLNTYYQITDPKGRWTNLRDDHELYCAGHLFQAAAAHFRATHSDALLTVAQRFADCIDGVFGAGRMRGVPGHPEIEMALVELYRTTRQDRYLKLAQFFIDERGQGLIGGRAYHQDHVSVRDAMEPAGHAVRQLYLLAGMADLYLEMGEQSLMDAMDRLWDDMCTRKMSITGGVGARHEGEAFGESYELPNDRVYNETCAQIASVMWNWRLLLATGECRYADLMEWTLYNGVISGVSLDGRRFFYPNPLLSRGNIVRSGWFACACCPPNVMRTLASIHNYAVTCNDAGLQIHLYDRMRIEAADLHLEVDTDYPWQPGVGVRVDAAGSVNTTISLRIPRWCGRPIARVNGVQVDGVRAGAYCDLRRSWRSGDTIEFDLPMLPVFREAHPFVEPARGCVALSRGPLVYCFEGLDQPAGTNILGAAIDTAATVEESWQDELLSGVMMLRARGIARDHRGWSNELYRPIGAPKKGGTPIELKAIPYFAWANRESAPMVVWVPQAG
jgi:DUF1680 family protein